MKISGLSGVLFTFLFSTGIVAQDFGGIPSSIKWKQFENRQVRVIYPHHLTNTAKNIAFLSTYLDSFTHSSIGQKSKKIDIVLQPYTSISNGYVALSPWKSEFYLTPLQNALSLGSTNWTTLLTIHEFRHVQQYSNFNHGFSKVFYFLLGQDGQALANSTAIPNWFFEGDAVFQETAVTGLGRGRLPDFYAEFRSLWDAKRNFSYMKLRNGSFRHLTPDHYSLGYLLVAYGNLKYGDEFWRNVTYDASGFKSPVYPFQNAIQKYSGIKFKQFVNEATSYFKKDSVALFENTDQQVSTNSNKFIKEYSFPTFINEDSILYLKNTGSHLPAWYVLSKGKENKIATRDIGIDDQFSYRKGLIAYTYYKPDPRWGMRNFNEIAILDIHSGQRKLFTNHARLFSPDISPDTAKIVAVKINDDASSDLVLMNMNGSFLKNIQGNGYIHSYPKFSVDGNSVFSCIRDSSGNMNLLKTNLINSSAETLLPWTRHPISFTTVRGDSIFFTAALNGMDRLMCWDEKNKKLYQIISKYSGVQQSDIFNNNIVFTSTNAWGVHIYKTKGLWQQFSLNEYSTAPMDMYGISYPKYDFTKIQNDSQSLDTAKKYSKATRLINIHSWRPVWEQPDWSFHLYGNNVLNTFLSEYYYQFNSNEKFHKIGTDFAFAGLYPWLTGGASYTAGRNITIPDGRVNWDEFNLNAGLRLPLTFTKGLQFSAMNIQSTINLNSIIAKPGTTDLLRSSKFPFIENVFSYFIRSQKALQHINPRFGVSLFVRQRFGTENSAVNQFFSSASMFLPGVMRNHSIVLSGAYQSRDTSNQYIFSNSFPFSRGYQALNFPRMWKGAINYHLPLFYPDWGIGHIIYFQRIRTNLFYDHSMVKSLRTGRIVKVRSAGAEIYFDSKIWNQQSLTFGIRYSRLFDANIYVQQPNPNSWQIILPLDIISR